MASGEDVRVEILALGPLCLRGSVQGGGSARLREDYEFVLSWHRPGTQWL